MYAVQNVESLKDPEVVKQLGNILKTNVRACKALGHPFVLQVINVMQLTRAGSPFSALIVFIG